MPVIARSSYRAPLLFRSGHFQTVYPSLFRRLAPVRFRRERISTPDDDFLDLDWAGSGSRKLAVLSHGLEGNSRRQYMVGMAAYLNRHGWDALAWNYRGCSGEVNKKLRFYHQGAIDDLDTVVRHALRTGAYDALTLIGFSLGGNLTLVYLGSMEASLDPRVRTAVVFSVPCDLASSAERLALRRNRVYMDQFLRTLHGKIRAKMAVMPGAIDDGGFDRIRNFKDFDDRYTAPIHGFRDAEDYWRQCSSGQFLSAIGIPTLIVNAQDDPFLADGCYPVAAAASSSAVHLEMPERGGHVGFVQFNDDGSYWSEQRVMEFLNDTIAAEGAEQEPDEAGGRVSSGTGPSDADVTA